MIQITYEIAAPNRARFRDLMADLAHARRRNGAYGWSLMQDAEDPACFVETWFEASWVQHLRHHERVSGEDRAIQERVQALRIGAGAQHVRHLLST